MRKCLRRWPSPARSSRAEAPSAGPDAGVRKRHPRTMESEVQFCELQKQNLVAEVLRTSGKVRLAARGHSMLPTLWPGDLLTVETARFDQVSPGDVILYRRWERFFIHRVLRKSSGSDRPTLVTRGDSMSGFDPSVVPEQLLGKIVSVERVSGFTVPVPACSKFQRALGLTLGHSDRLRSLVLRWHSWRRRIRADSVVSVDRMPTEERLG